MGALNVRWESNGDSITWIWDRIPGAAYDFYAMEEAYNDSSNPCDFEAATLVGDGGDGVADTSYADLSRLVKGDVALLCVRTENTQNLEENLSFAWAATTPKDVPVGSNGVENDDTGKTTELAWTGDFDLLAGFDYQFRVAADPHRSNRISSATSASDVQAACEAGASVDDGDTDVMVTLSEVVVDRGLQPYTGYLLCMRYANASGQTEWAVPVSNGELYTTPAKPPSISLEDTFTNASTTEFVWSLDVRTPTNVPRQHGGFNATIIQYPEKWNHDGDDETSLRNAPTPKEAHCARAIEDDPEGWQDGAWTRADLGAAHITTYQDGIRVRSGTIYRPAADNEREDIRVYLCVQAHYTEGGEGPWRISSSREVKRQEKE